MQSIPVAIEAAARQLDKSPSTVYRLLRHIPVKLDANGLLTPQARVALGLEPAANALTIPCQEILNRLQSLEDRLALLERRAEPFPILHIPERETAPTYYAGTLSTRRAT